MVCPPVDGAVCRGHAQCPAFCSWLFRSGSWVLVFLYLLSEFAPTAHAHSYFSHRASLCLLPKETFVQSTSTAAKESQVPASLTEAQGAVTAAPPLREQSRFAGRLGGTGRSPPKGCGRSLKPGSDSSSIRVT